MLAAGATSSDKEQLRGPGTGSAKWIPKETKRNGQMGQKATTVVTVSKHDTGTPPKKKRQTEL